MVNRTLRFYYLKLVRQEGSPELISAGMALGVFIGLITPPGPQMIIAGIIATYWIKVNRITAIMGVWITNPLTMPFIYPLQIYIGSLIFNLDISLPQQQHFLDFWKVFFDLGNNVNIALALLAGAIISAIVLAIVSYYMTLVLVIYYRRQKLKRRIRSARQLTT